MRGRVDSDVNVLAAFKPEACVGFMALGRMAILGRSVDLVPMEGLKSTVREEALPGAEVLYAA